MTFTPQRDAQEPGLALAPGRGSGSVQGTRASLTATLSTVLEACVPLVVTRARTMVSWRRPPSLRLDEVLQACHLNATLLPMLAQGPGLGPGLRSAQGPGLGLSDTLITYWITPSSGTTAMQDKDKDKGKLRQVSVAWSDTSGTSCSASAGH